MGPVRIKSQIADRTGRFNVDLIVTLLITVSLRLGKVCLYLFVWTILILFCKDVLFQVWLELVKWFWRIFYCTGSQCIFFHYAFIIPLEKVWPWIWIILPKECLVWLKSSSLAKCPIRLLSSTVGGFRQWL